MTLLGWQQQQQAGGESGAKQAGTTISTSPAPAVGDKWSNLTSSSGNKPGDAKLRAKQIATLALFLETGFRAPAVGSADSAARRAAENWPLWHVDAHTIGSRANPYGYLNLFGAVRDEEGEMYDDVQGRKEVYVELLHAAVNKGMQGAKREGGETGRAAATLDKVLTQGLKE